MLYDLSVDFLADALAPQPRNSKDRVATCTAKNQTITVEALIQRYSGEEAEAEKNGKSTAAGSLAKLRRVTIVAQQDLAPLISPARLRQYFDLIAVQPTTVEAFSAACRTKDTDLISFDLSDKLPFQLSAVDLFAAVQQGIFFEICYRPLLKGSQEACATFLSRAQEVCQALKGRNLILSSGARSPQEMRAAQNIWSMASMLGLSHVQAKDAVGRNCASVLRHAAAAKHSQLRSSSAGQLASTPGSLGKQTSKPPLLEARPGKRRRAEMSNEGVAGAPSEGIKASAGLEQKPTLLAASEQAQVPAPFKALEQSQERVTSGKAGQCASSGAEQEQSASGSSSQPTGVPFRPPPVESRQADKILLLGTETGGYERGIAGISTHQEEPPAPAELLGRMPSVQDTSLQACAREAEQGKFATCNDWGQSSSLGTPESLSNAGTSFRELADAQEAAIMRAFSYMAPPTSLPLQPAACPRHAMTMGFSTPRGMRKAVARGRRGRGKGRRRH